MERRRVAVRGGMFETEVLEGGSGPTLLWLHGETGVNEESFLQELAKTHRVVAPRTPGFGDSVGDDHLIDLFDLLYYHLDLLDELGIDEAVVAGHGLGGMFAAELAAMQPQRFTKVLLLAPFGMWNPDYPVLDFFVASPQQLLTASFHDPESEAAQVMAMPKDEGDLGPVLDRVKSQRVAAKYLWPIPNRGLSKRIHRITPPALIVWGESDGIASPNYARDFQSGMKNATVELIPEAGHLPHIEQPEKTLEAIQRFLA